MKSILTLAVVFTTINQILWLIMIMTIQFDSGFFWFHLIVEFRIPGYPGPSKDQGTEVRLMQGKIFRDKIRM